MKILYQLRIRRITRIQLQGSYTVEATWIIAISLSMISALMMVGYDVFRDSIALTNIKVSGVDTVDLFRKGAVVSDIFKDLK
ncbi:MAG: hypothetical protein PUB24_07975 [Lachnospiraceae bacterium]|nr:hypothetical protein [Lachnospiraceae bacterium]MDD6192993.1 hypothetical protein [Lachnospiraceae bacterium]MDY4794009.1 hypothetical protein [Pararoseburia sp.]